MKNIFENINNILSEWDPLNVGRDIAADEYRAYVPLIVKQINSKEKLMHCLEDILINKLEVGYDKQNKEHILTLHEITDKILNVSRK